MSKCINNCLYNNSKLLHELSSSLWFIEKHGSPDAQKAGDTHCHKVLTEVANNLKQCVDKMKDAVSHCACD